MLTRDVHLHETGSGTQLAAVRACVCLPRCPRRAHPAPIGAGHPLWLPQESLAEQLEEGYQQAIWLPGRGRLQAQPGGGEAARLELSSHVEKGLYALFASGGWPHCLLCCLLLWHRKPPAPGAVWPSCSMHCGGMDGGRHGWTACPLASLPCPRCRAAGEEMWLCQDTSWGWLRKVGVSATAGQSRLRLRRGYEPPATKASGLPVSLGAAVWCWLPAGGVLARS